MVGVILLERWQEGFVQSLDEPVAHAYSITLLGGEWPSGIHHLLVVFVHCGTNGLAVGPNQSLQNVLQCSMGLVAAAQTELREDRSAYLLEAEFQDFGMDCIHDGSSMDICVA